MSEKKEEKVEEELKEPTSYSDPEVQKALDQRNKDLQAVLERKVYLSERYCEPHTVPSRRVKEEDLERVLHEAPLLHEMCMVGRGEYNSAYAIAHSQVEDKDPLRFFVYADGQIFINPVIIGHSHELYQATEGCMSYPEEPMKTTIRYKKVTVRYRTVAHKADAKTGEDLGQYFLSKEVTHEFDGDMAQVMQHECQHLNGSDIYKSGTSANDAMWEPKVDNKK